MMMFGFEVFLIYLDSSILDFPFLNFIFRSVLYCGGQVDTLEISLREQLDLVDTLFIGNSRTSHHTRQTSCYILHYILHCQCQHQVYENHKMLDI